MTASSLSPAGQARQSYAARTRVRRRQVILPLLAGSLAAVVFALTLAPDLTWANFGGDGGELITAAVTLGIPHPPGYPTYVLLGNLLSLLPPAGNMAWRFNAFSAVAMATAAAFATAAAYETTRPTRWSALASLAAALALAFAPLVWGQAIITEVYALNLAALAAFVWSLLGGRSRWLTGLLLGLAITTHLTSILMLPLALALTPRRGWANLLVASLVGVLPLLLLPLFASSGSPAMWGDPSNLGGWWRLVSGRIYAANVALPTPGTLVQTMSSLANALSQQWLWIGWLFVLFGLIIKPPDRKERLWLLATAVFYIVWAFLYRTDDAAVLLLPALLLLSPILARGLQTIGPLCLLLPLALLLLGLQNASLRGDHQVRNSALEVFAVAPPSAILLTPGDQSIFTLWYFQHVEGLRTDLALLDANLLAFDWYRAQLQVRYPDLAGLEADDLQQFQERNSASRPLCVLAPALSADYSCTVPPN